MNKDRIQFRSKIISFLLICAAVPFCVYMFSYSAALSGLNANSDSVKQELLSSEERASTIEGSIVDRNGDVITYAVEPGVPAECVYSSYGQLVGYNSPIYGVSGLRARFSEHLFKGDSQSNGATIRLTTINELQSAAYNAITGMDGAVVILDNHTGEILALATTNQKAQIDVNDLSNWQELNSIEGFFIPNWKVALAPGSVMKVVTASEIINKGWQENIYFDSGTETIGGYSFHNAGNMSYGNLTLESALVHSSNTYFSSMTNKLGSFNIRSANERFAIGKTLELDFTTISSSHGIDDSDIVETAAAGFGQGKLLVSPLNMAMIGQAIANDGIMLQPYLISSIDNCDGNIYSGQPTTLCESTSQQTAEILRNYLHTVASSYGIDESYKLCAKTGTAELGINNLYRAAFLCFDEDYTVVVVQNNTTKSGRSLAPIALSLFDILNSLNQQ